VHLLADELALPLLVEVLAFAAGVLAIARAERLRPLGKLWQGRNLLVGAQVPELMRRSRASDEGAWSECQSRKRGASRVCC
jgi:hypothetical protein